MITLAVTLGILIGSPYLQAKQPAKSTSVQLQDKVYVLTQAMEITGESGILDGHGATLSGNGKGIGIHVGAFGHVTLKNLKLTGFSTAILAQSSPELTIQNVSIEKSTTGINAVNVAGGLVQGIQAHSCENGVVLDGCSKVIFEKSDLSQNEASGIAMTQCSACIVRDNKVAQIGADAKASDSAMAGGIALTDCIHNQVLRNVVVRCRSFGISAISTKPGSTTDNTFQGNDVSWTTTGIGLSLKSETDDKVLDDTAGFCLIGYELSGAVQTTFRGNLVVGNIRSGVEDDLGSKNTYDTNVFVAENGGPLAMDLKGSDSVTADLRLVKNAFMGYLKPFNIENVRPVSLQSNTFPGAKSLAIEDLATIKGKAPISLDSQNDQPTEIELVPAVAQVAQLPSIFARLGGVRVSSSQGGDTDIVVEASLSGAFQGEQEVLARYKGELPIELTFPPRFEMFVRVLQLSQNSSYVTFIALLGDNSMAIHMDTDDSGNTLFTPSYAVDGDTKSTDNAWRPPKGKAGDWWEVTLKSDCTMNAMSVLANPANPDDFWSKFHIAVSSTGLFKGEETTVVTETNWKQRPGPQRIYRFPPVTAKYIRIYGDQDQDGVQLKQFGVYGIRQ